MCSEEQHAGEEQSDLPEPARRWYGSNWLLLVPMGFAFLIQIVFYADVELVVGASLQRSFLGALAFSLLILAGRNSRGWRLILSLALVAWTVVIVLLGVHYHYFRTLPIWSSAQLLPQLDDVLPSILDATNAIDWLLIVGSILVAGAAVLPRPKPWPKRYLSVLLLVLGLCVGVLPLIKIARHRRVAVTGVTAANRDRRFRYTFYFSSKDGLREYGIWGHLLYYSDLQGGQTEYDDPLPNPLPPPVASLSPSRPLPDVILIQVESLDRRLIGLQVAGREVTPFLNQLRRDAFFCPNFYAVHVNGGSSDAEFAALTGLLPVSPVATMTSHPLTHVPSLARDLKGAGYRCYAMHGNAADFWNRRSAYRQLGFDRFYAEEDYTGAARGFFSLDGPFLEQSLAHLRELREAGNPVFLYLITQTMHNPFKAPLPPDAKTAAWPVRPSGLERYFQAAHYTDQALARFMQTLRTDKRGANTVVVIFGDHVSRFDTRVYNSGHERGENVPLFILLPDKQGTLIERYASHVDVAPTVLEILGLPPNLQQFGRPLLEPQAVGLLPLSLELAPAVITPTGKTPLAQIEDPRYQQVIDYSRSFFYAVDASAAASGAAQ